MSFWVQHGYGKGDKIRDLVAGPFPPAGVILSPSSEPNQTLVNTAKSCDDSGVRILLDPETYVYSIDGGHGKKHLDNELDIGPLHWSDSPARLAGIVRAVVELNDQMGTSEVIAPAPVQQSFGDAWTGLALQLARETATATSKPVLASVVVDAGAFSDWHTAEQWLDAVTTLDTAGVYLLVGWDGATYPNTWDAAILKNIYRAVYRLAVINQYEVIWGYSDVAGAIGLAAGADGCATGWYLSLRLWTTQKWIPRSGGRQSAPRVMSVPMLSPLIAQGEADIAARTAIGSQIFPDVSIRSQLAAGTWGLAEAWYQHMEAVSEIASTITNYSDEIEERVEMALGWIDEAQEYVRRLDAAGVALPGVYQSRLRSLREALAGFANEEGIT